MSAELSQASRYTSRLNNDQLLVAAGATAAIPIAVGAMLSESSLESGASLCIFSTATGLPCPFCGGTRSFVAFAHGDASWLEFNGYWVLVSLTVIAAVTILGLIRGLSRSRFDQSMDRVMNFFRSRRAWLLTAAAVLPGWVWALLNIEHLN